MSRRPDNAKTHPPGRAKARRGSGTSRGSPPRDAPRPAPSTARKWLFRLLAATLVPAALLAALELGLRLFGYGHPAGFLVSHPRDGTYSGNERFGWRFFPRALSRAPVLFSLPARKDAGTFRIFVLGGSAAAGTPDSAFHFGRILQVMLRDRYPGVRFEVVNAAMTAVNSHVARVIAADCAAHEPDLFVVYMGNNEVVGPYGPGTVFAGYTPSRDAIRASIFVRGFRTGQLVAGITGWFAPGEAAGKWRGMEMFAGHRVAADDPRLGRVYDHFRANLGDICRTAREAGARTLLCTVATNLRDCPPFASVHRADLPETDASKFQALYDAGVSLEAPGTYAEALARYRRAAEIDGRFAELHFRAGRCCVALGRTEEARRHLVLARDMDALRFRADTKINETIRQVAAADAGRGVHLVDAEAAFARNPEALLGIPGDEAFYEHVHLRFEGNCLLAAAVFRKVAALLPAPGGGAPAGEPPDSRRCAELCGYTPLDRYRSGRSMERMMGRAPFTGQLGHAERLRRLRQELDRASRQFSEADIRRMIEQKRKALERAPDDLLLRDNYARTCSDYRDPVAAEEHWRLVLQRVPQSTSAQANLALVLVRQAQFEEAIALLEEVLEIRPDHPEVLNTLGVALFRRGRTGEAVEALRRCLAGDPANWAGRNDLAAALAKEGRNDEAARQFREALRIAPDNVASRFGLAGIYLRKRDYARAIEELNAILRRGPDVRAQFQLSVALARQGRLAVAIQAAEKALAQAKAAGNAPLSRVIEQHIRLWRKGPPR